MKKSSSYELGAIFLPAPFMRKAIIRLDSKDPAEAITAMKKLIEDLKGEKEEDDSELLKKLKNIQNG